MTEDSPARYVEDREQYAYLQYHFVQFLTEHLADCSRRFDGDLQEMLVLAVIGQVHLNAFVERLPDGNLVRRELAASRSIGASRLADVTGISRETVRRKLEKLKRRGWIEPAPAGRWQLCLKDGFPIVRRELGDLDSRSIERALSLQRALDRVK